MSQQFIRHDEENWTPSNVSNKKLPFLFAIFGQGLFSLSRFITTMVIGGRFNPNDLETGAGSESELGLYLAYFSVLLFGLGFLDAFVTIPMTYLMHSRPEKDKPQFSTFLLIACIVLSALFFGFVLLSGALVRFSYPSISLATLAAFAFLLATQCVREFLVRWLLAHLKIGAYAAYEFACLLFYAAGITLVIACQQVFLTPLFLLIAVSNLAMIGLVWRRHRSAFTSIKTTLQQTGIARAPDDVSEPASQKSESQKSELWHDFTSTLKEQIYFGRWLAADSVFAIMTVYFFNWFLLLKIDAAAAGIYGACMTIVLLANPLLNGVISAFAPMAAIEYESSGKSGLNKILLYYGSAMAALMLAFVAVLWFAGGPLTKLLYGAKYDLFFAEHYSGENRIPFLLGLSMPLNAVAYMLACSLMASGVPKYNCFSSLAGLVAVVCLGAMMQKPDLVSCALCFSISIGVTLAFRSFFYWFHRGEPQTRKTETAPSIASSTNGNN